MDDLTKTEERVMHILWGLKKAFIKDIIRALPDDPKPPYNTISSLVRLLEKKKYVGYHAYGKTHEYFPVISKAEYRRACFKNMLAGYFDNSTGNLLSFLVKEQNISKEEMKVIKDLISKNSNL